MLNIIIVGLGGFTTFSAFALESTELIKAGNDIAAFIYMIGSVLAGIVVIFAVEYFIAR